MATIPTLTITSALGSNNVRITPSFITSTAGTLYNVSVLLNEISVVNGFVEKNIPFKDESDVDLTVYTLGAPDVTSGNSYMLKIRQFYKDEITGAVTIIESNSVSITIQSVPVPQFQVY